MDVNSDGRTDRRTGGNSPRVLEEIVPRKKTFENEFWGSLPVTIYSTFIDVVIILTLLHLCLINLDRQTDNINEKEREREIERERERETLRWEIKYVTFGISAKKVKSVRNAFVKDSPGPV